jgi:uncharacterized membrane protein
MPQIFQILLISHILLGLTGIGLFTAVLVALLKKAPSLNFLKITSLLGLISFIGSWIAGGYYYVNFYGGAVKPIIKAGEYPWAHKVIMETKEHAFLFLPFLAAIVFLSIWLLNNNLTKDKKLKNTLTFLTFIIVALGITTAFMGMVISGAANPGTPGGDHDHESHEHSLILPTTWKKI